MALSGVEFATLGFDIALVILGFYFVFAAMEMRKAKGSFGAGATLFCWSLVILGLVHLLETALGIFYRGRMSSDWNELSHRVLVFISMLVIVFGFITFKKDIFIPPKSK